MPVRLSILIPVYNEARSIKMVLLRVVTAAASYFQAEQAAVEAIVVDDGSDDASYEEVRAFSLEHSEVSWRLIRHKVSAGKGAAVRAAIAQAQGEFCLIQGTDLEYDPRDYSKLLSPLFSGDADVVLGSCFINGVERRTMSLLAGLKLSDAGTGYIAFHTWLGKSVPLRTNRYGLVPELIVQFAKRHARFIKVPLSHSGPKIGAWDACLVLGNVLRARLFGAANTNAAADMQAAISQAHRFNRWMADTVKPWIAGDVLELGAGIGNLTVLLSAAGDPYMATDIDKGYLFELHSRTACRPNVKLSIFDFSSTTNVRQFRQSADTVICLNVLEHLADDVGALANVHRCLRPGGTAIVLVPQSPELFGSLDEVLEHKRRYTREELERKMAAAGFRVKQTIEFNRATWPGWYLNSRVLRRRTLNRLQLRLFDLLAPLWRRIDHRLPWPATSLIAIGVATS